MINCENCYNKMPGLFLDNFTNWLLSVVTYLWAVFGLVGNSTWMPQIQAMLYVHDLHWAHKSNKTTKVKFTVYWPVIYHVTVVVFFLLTNMYKTIKALEGITRNNGNTLILPINVVQGTVPVYTDWLVFSGHVHTLPDNFSCRHESMNTYPICDSSL